MNFLSAGGHLLLQSGTKQENMEILKGVIEKEQGKNFMENKEDEISGIAMIALSKAVESIMQK